MLSKIRIAVDCGFWPQIAAQVQRAGQTAVAPERDLRAVCVVLPRGAHAAALRSALFDQFHASYVSPRMVVWPEWGASGRSGGLAHRASLFDALRGNTWVRTYFGSQSRTLWNLAQQIEVVADELTYAAVDGTEAMVANLEAALARHYRRGAARVALPQSRLLLDLWRAGGDSGAAERVANLHCIAEAATAPLVFVAAEEIEPWMQAVLAKYSMRAPVTVIEPDVAATIARIPLVAAAWPEIASSGTDIETPIAARADAVRDGVSMSLQIVTANSLEDEASTAARQVVDWLDEGVGPIALVTLNRLTARRVRALLERAHVLVRDETGWKLSTTSAAAAVMRWYDLLADNLYWRDVLDWLKSPFTLVDEPSKPRGVAALERAIRAGGAVQGAHAIRRALDVAGVQFDAADLDGARELMQRIELQARASGRAAATLGERVADLQCLLDALGMRAALAADVVGAAVLRELDTLSRDLASVTVRVSVNEFRALLAARFEELSFVDRSVDSPVVLVSLAATTLRRFSAVVLIGADAEHLPSLPAETLFLPQAVRTELGLPHADVHLRRQAAQLALLLVQVPRVVATWREHDGDEPNALSPLLERLQFVAERAMGRDLVRDREHDHGRIAEPVVVTPVMRPAPMAAPLLPDRISASQAQSLVHCPYQFYARRLLNLTELDDVLEMPDKRDFGEALHDVLRRFHRQWGEAAFHECDPDELAASLRAHAAAVFGPQIERAPMLLAYARRFDGLVNGYLEWLREHSAAGWRWTGAEEKRSVVVTLRDGDEVKLTGRIDRIDTDGEGQVCVLDYKAKSASDLKAGLREPGEDIQLPFYGLLLGQRAGSAAYVAFERGSEQGGGVQAIDARNFQEVAAAVEARLVGDLQRIADGAPLPAIGAAAVCGRCEMRGLCRRDYWSSGDSGVSGASGESGDGVGRVNRDENR